MPTRKNKKVLKKTKKGLLQNAPKASFPRKRESRNHKVRRKELLDSLVKPENDKKTTKAFSPMEPRQQGFELPHGYNDNRIVLMVRDPYWLYAYWEINANRIKGIKHELGDKLKSSSLILRVYDTSNWRFFDIGVDGYINNWYINVGRPNTSFCIDAGYLSPDGYFVCAARSNVVTTPRDKMSDVIDEEWMIIDWEKMYALSGGHAPSSWSGSQALRRE